MQIGRNDFHYKISLLFIDFKVNRRAKGEYAWMRPSFLLKPVVSLQVFRDPNLA